MREFTFILIFSTGISFSQDSDGDGLSDLLETAHGTPVYGDNTNCSNHTCLEIVGIGANKYPAISFRTLQGVSHRHNYQVQESRDLVNWTDVDMKGLQIGNPVTVNDCQTVDIYTIRGEDSINLNEKSFLRVEVLKPLQDLATSNQILTLSNLKNHINTLMSEIIPDNTHNRSMYDLYSSTGDAQWCKFSWTSRLDFTGIANDNTRAGTLISPRHVVYSTHWARPVNSELVFHDRDGKRHARTVIDNRSLPGGNNPDITIGLLDSDVPSTVKYYNTIKYYLLERIGGITF